MASSSADSSLRSQSLQSRTKHHEKSRPRLEHSRRNDGVSRRIQEIDDRGGKRDPSSDDQPDRRLVRPAIVGCGRKANAQHGRRSHDQDQSRKIKRPQQFVPGELLARVQLEEEEEHGERDAGCR